MICKPKFSKKKQFLNYVNSYSKCCPVARARVLSLYHYHHWSMALSTTLLQLNL